MAQIEPALERVLIQVPDLRPVQAGRFRRLHILGDDALDARRVFFGLKSGDKKKVPA